MLIIDTELLLSNYIGGNSYVLCYVSGIKLFESVSYL